MRLGSWVSWVSWVSPRRVKKWGRALEYASLAFGIEGCVVARRDGFSSGVVLWDTPSASFRSRNVVGVVGGHRDVLGSGGGLWDTPASRLGSWVSSVFTEIC